MPLLTPEQKAALDAAHAADVGMTSWAYSTRLTLWDVAVVALIWILW